MPGTTRTLDFNDKAGYTKLGPYGRNYATDFNLLAGIVTSAHEVFKKKEGDKKIPDQNLLFNYLLQACCWSSKNTA